MKTGATAVPVPAPAGIVTSNRGYDTAEIKKLNAKTLLDVSVDVTMMFSIFVPFVPPAYTVTKVVVAAGKICTTPFLISCGKIGVGVTAILNSSVIRVR